MVEELAELLDDYVETHGSFLVGRHWGPDVILSLAEWLTQHGVSLKGEDV